MTSVMDRREFLGTLGIGILIAPVTASAQQAGRIYRVGVLGAIDSPPWEAFRQGLRDLGYIEGRNLSLVQRFSGGRNERLRELAADLVGLQVDVIMTAGSEAPQAARTVTGSIPIVMGAANDPVGVGLIATFAHPGGNVTGLSFDITQQEGAKRLDLLKELAPKASRIAYLPGSTGETALAGARLGARSLGVQLRIHEVRTSDDLDRMFAAVMRERPDALLVSATPGAMVHRTQIIDLATRSRLPAMYGFREPVEAGGLISYGPSLPDMLRRAATFVDRILRGAKPGDLPVEQPTKFELVINLKTAKALGLTIPPSVLLRADQIIE